MTPARRLALRSYLARCAEALRLGDWDVEVSDEAPIDGEVVLNVSTHPARHAATFRVGSFFEEDAREQAIVVGHEMVHLAQADLKEFIDGFAWRRQLSPDVAALIEERFRQAQERTADSLGRALVAVLPPAPEWPE